jgi:hypothetical protein
MSSTVWMQVYVFILAGFETTGRAPIDGMPILNVERRSR